MHSIGMSRRYLVLVEFPFRLARPLDLLFTGRPFIENYAWRDDLPSVFWVIDKDTGAIVTRAEGPPFFAFHHINAWEEGDSLVVDLAAYDGPQLIEQLLLERVRADDAGIDCARLLRCHVPLSGGPVTIEPVGDALLELPRMDERRLGSPYQSAYGASLNPGDRDFLNQLVKINVTTGESWTWREDGCYPGEPVFVPRPGSVDDDDGVILSVVLDGLRGESFLLVQDAATFAEIARARAPVVVPFGFHGMMTT
jgi:beta,beta-carotene 9',10'-dioxygenase